MRGANGAEVMTMQAMTTLGSGWARSQGPAPLARRHWPAHLPEDLRVYTLGPDVVAVRFSRGPLLRLSRCELDVARWASEGHTNAGIASRRGTSSHTVARQVRHILSKLGIGARLELSTVAELSIGAPGGRASRVTPGAANDSWLLADGVALGPEQAARTWREIALGHWRSLASLDVGAETHVAMRCAPSGPVDWGCLSPRERDALELVALGVPQKVVAMKLGLAPSTVSSVLTRARARMGFATLGHLLRAYCATRPESPQ